MNPLQKTVELAHRGTERATTLIGAGSVPPPPAHTLTNATGVEASTQGACAVPREGPKKNPIASASQEKAAATPINITKLEQELSGHPNRVFVDKL